MEEKILITLLLLLIIFVILNKKFTNYFIKLCVHIFIYCFEIMSVCYLMNLACINFELFSSPSNYLEALRNYVFYYTLYQLILTVTFKLYDAAETDALTAIKSTLDKLQVFFEFKKKSLILQEIQEIQENIDSTEITFSNKHRLILQELIQNLQSYNSGLILEEDIRLYLKSQSLKIDLQLKAISFSWMNSILLRIGK